jgi:hypothetical protein
MPWGERYPVPAPDATGPEAGGQDQREARGGRSAVGS